MYLVSPSNTIPFRENSFPPLVKSTACRIQYTAYSGYDAVWSDLTPNYAYALPPTKPHTQSIHQTWRCSAALYATRVYEYIVLVAALESNSKYKRIIIIILTMTVHHAKRNAHETKRTFRLVKCPDGVLLPLFMLCAVRLVRVVWGWRRDLRSRGIYRLLSVPFSMQHCILFYYVGKISERAACLWCALLES